MSAQNLTLSVPLGLYTQIKELADQRNQSIEDETLDLLASAVPGNVQLPTDLAKSVESLSLLEDEALWRAARSHLAKEASKALERLHFKKQRQGLTLPEQEKADGLVREYDRAMIIRARAAQILHERGYDISELGPSK